MGSPSAIELAESNRNLDFLEHSLVREYIRIVWLGMAFEKCFATEKRRDPDYNPYLMPNFYGKSNFGNKKDNSESTIELTSEGKIKFFFKEPGSLCMAVKVSPRGVAQYPGHSNLEGSARRPLMRSGF